MPTNCKPSHPFKECFELVFFFVSYLSSGEVVYLTSIPLQDVGFSVELTDLNERGELASD